MAKTRQKISIGVRCTALNHILENQPVGQKSQQFANPKENVLERIIFKHKTQNVYLVADAYRGSKMKETINDFFSAITGEILENVKAENETLQILGSANVVAFVGHDGLMDFKLEKELIKKDEDKRDAIVLACASRQLFWRTSEKDQRQTTALDFKSNGSRSVYFA